MTLPESKESVDDGEDINLYLVIFIYTALSRGFLSPPSRY